MVPFCHASFFYLFYRPYRNFIKIKSCPIYKIFMDLISILLVFMTDLSRSQTKFPLLYNKYIHVYFVSYFIQSSCFIFLVNIYFLRAFAGSRACPLTGINY